MQSLAGPRCHAPVSKACGGAGTHHSRAQPAVLSRRKPPGQLPGQRQRHITRCLEGASSAHEEQARGSTSLGLASRRHDDHHTADLRSEADQEPCAQGRGRPGMGRLWARREEALQLMSRSSNALPYAVVAAAALALFVPASFAWFTPDMYAPGLGFLMFAVGVNLRAQAFAEVFRTPKHIVVGSVGQWVVKPLLGLVLALTMVPMLGLPNAVGTGLILVACVSGAQLSNYATFLVHPEQAPLSIVLTALSTAAGVFLTPLLALVLLGARIPVDAASMALSIVQIVLVPVLAGLTCSTYFPGLVASAKPFFTFFSLLDTCACVGASLASNSATARSAVGTTALLPVAALHIAAYYLGYQLARRTIAQDSVPLARCISLETGMQSGLLGLLLATRFFSDPLVALPCGISTIFMTLSGFGLVVWWQRQKASAELQLQSH